MPDRLVAVGGNAGAMGAAAQAKRLEPALDIVAFERGRRTSSAACGVPFYVGGEVVSLDTLVARTPDEHEQRGIDVRLGHEVVGIDLARRVVEVRAVDGDRTIEEGFDRLVIGTGARPFRPSLPGIDLPSVHGVQTLDDAETLFGEAERARSRDVVVVGGGYIGLEMAEAFTRWGARVVVVESSPHVMHTLDRDIADLVSGAMERFGITVRTGVTVTAIERSKVTTTEGDLPADLVVLGMGVAPNSEVARDAGIALGAGDAIAVDERQRTSVDGVWAAGDCCDSYHRVLGQRVHIALGTVTNRQSRVAGIDIAGGDATFPGVIGTAVTRVCRTEIGRTGLNEAEAQQAGFAFRSAVIESTTRASYYPDAERITVKLVADAASGRVLGGQIVGGAGSAKRIDTVAAVVWNGMTAEEVVNLDLSYAPPFSPVWDPVQTAARRLLSP
jgi:NADPH-dependent 2,4-dienoyl-CoA reductase/sulfur reductase-like enzyme